MSEETHITGSWQHFEAWIKDKVGGDFYWKVRPRDTETNRMIVADSVVDVIDKNNGNFPPSGNTFIEPEENK
jgi:hypothetical protein